MNVNPDEMPTLQEMIDDEFADLLFDLVDRGYPWTDSETKRAGERGWTDVLA